MHLGTQKSQEDMREVAEQSRQVRGGPSCAWWQKESKPKPPPPPPGPTHTQESDSTTLFGILKPTVPGGEREEREGRWVRRRLGRGGGVLETQVGVGGEGASWMGEASRLACSSPRRTSSGVGPGGLECGRRLPGSCQGPPLGAACSSSLPWPCCSRPSQNTFAGWKKKNIQLKEQKEDFNL